MSEKFAKHANHHTQKLLARAYIPYPPSQHNDPPTNSEPADIADIVEQIEEVQPTNKDEGKEESPTPDLSHVQVKKNKQKPKIDYGNEVRFLVLASFKANTCSSQHGKPFVKAKRTVTTASLNQYPIKSA